MGSLCPTVCVASALYNLALAASAAVTAPKPPSTTPLAQLDCLRDVLGRALQRLGEATARFEGAAEAAVQSKDAARIHVVQRRLSDLKRMARMLRSRVETGAERRRARDLRGLASLYCWLAERRVCRLPDPCGEAEEEAAEGSQRGKEEAGPALSDFRLMEEEIKDIERRGPASSGEEPMEDRDEYWEIMRKMKSLMLGRRSGSRA